MSGWRRFERASSEGGRFWAIRTVGSVCELRFGAIEGDSATLERIEHDSEAAAKRTAKQKIRNKVRAGWIEVDLTAKPRPELGSMEAIERALAEDPTNFDNWAVYSDLLQSIDPLLGERAGSASGTSRSTQSLPGDPCLPRLRHLVVEWSNRCEHLLRGLARAPRLLAQLETLTIHQSNLRDRDAEVLLANADAFSGPRGLRLVDVRTSAEHTHELHALLPNLLEFDPTTPDDDDDLGPEEREILERLRS